MSIYSGFDKNSRIDNRTFGNAISFFLRLYGSVIEKELMPLKRDPTKQKFIYPQSAKSV